MKFIKKLWLKYQLIRLKEEAEELREAHRQLPLARAENQYEQAFIRNQLAILGK